MLDKKPSILEVINLFKHFEKQGGFFSKKSTIAAVRGVSFEMAQGETLGLVGESGSGKSTIARAILRLIPKDGGEVFFFGRSIFALKGKELARVRRDIQIIFQSPDASLNPRKTIYSILKDPLIIQKIRDEGRIKEVLRLVGLSGRDLSSFPHQFSLGQKQRIAIARSLVSFPKFLVADEPVSSLDISISASIINLLSELKERMGLSMLFISHDLRMVEYIADRVAVIYSGKIVEIGEKREVFDNPRHPYTRLLIDSIPANHPEGFSIPQASESSISSGCRFAERCPEKKPICKEMEPEMTEISSSHSILCHN
ncbi:MAG: oligopeptide/dipeptide ABC transporter ATP-binding protein [bacterium]